MDLAGSGVSNLTDGKHDRPPAELIVFTGRAPLVIRR